MLESMEWWKSVRRSPHPMRSLSRRNHPQGERARVAFHPSAGDACRTANRRRKGCLKAYSPIIPTFHHSIFRNPGPEFLQFSRRPDSHSFETVRVGEVCGSIFGACPVLSSPRRTRRARRGCHAANLPVRQLVNYHSSCPFVLFVILIVILIVIVIVIEYEYAYVNVTVNDARHSAWGQRRREMPIPCGENEVDKARDKVFDKEKSHANPGSTRF